MLLHLTILSPWKLGRMPHDQPQTERWGQQARCLWKAVKCCLQLWPSWDESLSSPGPSETPLTCLRASPLTVLCYIHSLLKEHLRLQMSSLQVSLQANFRWILDYKQEDWEKNRDLAVDNALCITPKELSCKVPNCSSWNFRVAQFVCSCLRHREKIFSHQFAFLVPCFIKLK